MKSRPAWGSSPACSLEGLGVSNSCSAARVRNQLLPVLLGKTGSLGMWSLFRKGRVQLLEKTPEFKVPVPHPPGRSVLLARGLSSPAWECVSPGCQDEVENRPPD